LIFPPRVIVFTEIAAGRYIALRREERGSIITDFGGARIAG